MTLIEDIPNLYFVILLNSNLIFDYYREFINCTVNIQINDIRKLPVIIPDATQLEFCKKIFDNILQIKKSQTDTSNLIYLEKELDLFIDKLYSI